jgi:hypothetical protein
LNRFLSTTSLPRQAPEARMNPLSDSMSQSTGLRRVAAAVRSPFLAICRLDAPRALRAPSTCSQYLGPEPRLAGYAARGPESRGPSPLGSSFSPSGPSLAKARRWAKGLRESVIIACSFQLPYSIQVKLWPVCAAAWSGRKREEPARTGSPLHLTKQETQVRRRPVAGLNTIRTPAEERKPAL